MLWVIEPCSAGFFRSGIALRVHVERGWLLCVVLFPRRGHLSRDLLRHRDFFFVFENDLSISGEELLVDLRVRDVQPSEDVCGRIEVAFRTARIHFATRNIRAHLFDHVGGEPANHSFPRARCSPVSKGVVHANARIDRPQVLEFTRERESPRLSRVVQQYHVRLSGEGVNRPQHRHEWGDSRPGCEKEIARAGVGIRQVKRSDGAQHVEHRSRLHVLVRPLRHLAISLDGDRECPGLSGRTRQRIAPVDGLPIVPVHREGDVQVLPGAERERGAIDAAKHEGHHVAGFELCLDALREELLWVPRPECTCRTGSSIRRSAQHTVPRHFQAANALGLEDGATADGHATYSFMRCVYQLMKASTWYSLFMYGPCSYPGLDAPFCASSTR